MTRPRITIQEGKEEAREWHSKYRDWYRTLIHQVVHIQGDVHVEVPDQDGQPCSKRFKPGDPISDVDLDHLPDHVDIKYA